MVSMGSLDAAFLCPRCGCASFHSNSGEYIDALRRQIAELQFKKALPRSRTDDTGARRRRAATPTLSFLAVPFVAKRGCST
jgi:hypothetical protein